MLKPELRFTLHSPSGKLLKNTWNLSAGTIEYRKDGSMTLEGSRAIRELLSCVLRGGYLTVERKWVT